MKQLYAILINTNKNFAKLLLAILLITTSFYSYSQVRVPFTPRQSNDPANSGKTIYSVRGDFTMAGNTNLQLVDQTQTQNGNNQMQYVDIDGDNSTFNSSSAYISFSEENGAIQECSNIIYAGLYWTGRSILDSNDPFTVTRDIPTGNTIFQQVTDQLVIRNGEGVIPNTDYTLVITDTGGNDSDMTFTFTSSGTGDTIAFIHRNNGGDQLLDVSVNGGAPVRLLTEEDGDDVRERSADLDPPYLIFDNLGANSGFRIELDELSRNDNNGNVNDDDTNATINVTYIDSVPEVTSVSKTFDKRKVSIKHSSGTYTEVTANANDIFFPINADGSMFSAYAEVTDIVRANGIGEYTVADIALVEGNGGSTGFYGGWGMVVVYENNVMNFRDVTVFDGHAFVIGGNAENIFQISGFNAVQNGPVGVKLGVMAGEGDSPISGDTFNIQRLNNNNDFVTLDRDGNTSGLGATGGNFFNSSVQSDPRVMNPGGTRNPNLTNNTGLDIGIFNIDNPNNSIIDNGQTSTQFRYGSTQDTYIIFNVTFSVDAIVPSPEGIITTDGVSVSDATVEPGQNLAYKFDIRNRGVEAINDTRIVIPVPYTATYVPNSLQATGSTELPLNGNLPTFDPNLGMNGSIVWDLGTLPVPANIDTILASFTFSLKATEECFILLNDNCSPEIIITGDLSGIGAISQNPFTIDLIQGFEQDGICIGRPIPTPLITPIVNIDPFVAANCGTANPLNEFAFCITLGDTTIPFSDIVDLTGNDLNRYPDGFRFFNLPNATENPAGLIEYTQATGFPATIGDITYYAIPEIMFGLPADPSIPICFFDFTITILPPLEVDAIDATNVSCFGEADGSISLTIGGGSGDSTNLAYDWTGPNGFTATTESISNLEPGTYNVTITDTSGIGCTTTAEATITEPIQVTVDATSTNVSCFGEADGTITISGLSAGATTTITLDGGNGDDLSAQTVFGPGTYTITASADGGNTGDVCTAIAQVTITEPIQVTVDATSTNVSCFGEADGTITISGLSAGATTTITLDGGNGDDLSAQTVFGPGTYTITASADGGNTGDVCTAIAQVTITEPIQVTVDATSTNVSCFGEADGTITISGLSAGATTTITLDGGNGDDLSAQTVFGPGTYTITASADGGNTGDVCTAIAQVTITEPNELIITLDSQTDVDCTNEAGGIIVVSVTGGTAPYTYTINDANNTTQDNGTFSDLVAGTYTITVTDNNGCTDSIIDIVIDAATADTINLNGAACIDDGVVDLNSFLGNNQATDGIWEFTAGLGNPVIFNESEVDPSNLPLGDYVFTYTNLNALGCLETTILTLDINDDCVVLPCNPDDMVISKAVTPNGDQYNQFFTITGLETCGFTMQVQIFNRWGSLIFQSNDYQNDWSGESSDNSVGSSNRVPSGTYYYIINLQNSGLRPFSGPIYVGTR
ncbi:hypothetical protein D7030_03470 [Flavobacteriaceae bacterium AU392]|nr:hypothetical protein D7030_03470 [Flavobacteriaceae bacterium AU392]